MKSTKKFWFITGSQDLYGNDVLDVVAKDSQEIVKYINSKSDFELVWKETVKSNDEIFDTFNAANADKDCIGVITWNHTFSPSKMWINGLNILNKPVLHLHTQFNKEIPWNEIDMDYMNTHQSAHGDREHGYIFTRMDINRKVVVGHYKSDDVINQLNKWFGVATAADFSRNLKVARFGDNMREVAVTEGDKITAQIKLGWQVNTHPVGDLVKYIDAVTDADVEKLFNDYKAKYKISDETLADASKVESIKYQGKMELGMKAFLEEGNFGAYTNTFQDLHGMKQLPGLASQRLMEAGYGFGPEGDWKISALLSIMKVMAGNKETSLMEDYTYNLVEGNESILGAHMLEVCPTVAGETPKIEVHELGIGGKEAPARMVFKGKAGKGVCASLIDMGGRLRLIVLDVNAIDAPQDMPNLPVASVFWKPEPNFEVGCKAWIYAGGAHHAVFSQVIDSEDLRDFADIMGIECVVIDKNTEIHAFRKELELNNLIARIKG